MTNYYLCDIIIFMSRKSFFLIVFLILGAVCFSQSADFITEMIEAETVSYEDVGYLCAVNLGLVSDSSSTQDALIALDKAGVISMPKEPTANISYSALANMCMKTWKIKGGLLYRITKANRYAFREFQSRGLIGTTVDPYSTVTGIQVLNLITQCMEIAGEIN